MIKRSGDKEIRVHDLRHSHVAMLVNMGFAIEEISRRLGHDSIKPHGILIHTFIPEQTGS